MAAPTRAQRHQHRHVGRASPNRLKWNLWHGNVHKALQILEDLEFALDLGGPTAALTFYCKYGPAF